MQTPRVPLYGNDNQPWVGEDQALGGFADYDYAAEGDMHLINAEMIQTLICLPVFTA